MRKTWTLLAAALAASAALTACSGTNKETKAPETTTAATESGSVAETTTAAENTKLEDFVIGASPAPHAEILKAAQEGMKAKGYNLVIKEYIDYVQPNMALEAGDLDANYFQHYPYLEQFNIERKTNLSSAAAIHYEPFGIYAGKTASLADLKEGAKVAVPNDATNEARALLLLESQGLITLKEGAGLNATKKDILENEKKLNIMEIEAAQIPRSLQDVDIAVINGNYAIEAGLKVSDALVTEDAKSVAATTYGNIVAVKVGNEKNEAVLALIEVLTGEEIKAFMEEKYEGAVVPLF